MQSPVTADGATDGEKPAAVILDATGLRTAGRPGRRARLPGPGDQAAAGHRAGADPGRPAVRGRLPGPGRRPAGAGRTGPLHRQGAARTGRRRTCCYVPGRRRGLDRVSPVRFFLSGRSAYVDGQVVTLSAADVPDRRGRRQAAGRQGRRRHRRGPGHRRRDREGAWPGTARTSSPSTSRPPGESLAAVANEIGGTALQLDITAADAPQRLIEHLRERHGGVDVVVHNAGITRDKLLVNMDAARWNSVMAVNLQAQLDITAGAAGRRRRAAGRRPDRLRLLAVGHRRQPRPDQLRGVQGRGHRHGARLGAGVRRARRRRSTPSRRASSSPR